MIKCLSVDHDVIVVGRSSNVDRGYTNVSLEDKRPGLFQKVRNLTNLMLGRYESVIWTKKMQKLASEISQKHFDIIVCHDLELLPFVQRIKNDAKVIFDAREYYPQHFEDKFEWRFLYQQFNRNLCENYLHLSDYTITVSDGIAILYRKEFNINVEVIQSWPEYHDLQPSKVNPRQIRIIHHGNATSTRKIEYMIHVMDHIDGRFHLDLMLVNTSGKYFKFLVKEAAERNNVSIISPVGYSDIVSFSNSYDVGLFLVPPVTTNLLNVLPNKFFEFIQSRLAVAIGPSPDMASIVREYDLGLVATDFQPETLARELNMLTTEKLVYYKNQSHHAAAKLNSLNNCSRMSQIFDEIVSI